MWFLLLLLPILPLFGEPLSLHLDYKECKTELCQIGAQYATDKTPWQKRGYRHPYSLFYHSLFKEKRNDKVVMAELGIAYGGSLLMWRDYFSNSLIRGFEWNPRFIVTFRKNHNEPRIELFPLNVKEKSSITDAFLTCNQLFDLIIEDTTHEFDDQVRVIENALPYLKPGGMLVIEDVVQKTPEEEYMARLQPLLDQFQESYFVTLNHNHRFSGDWKNDKLFVLVKGGARPLFPHSTKMRVITTAKDPTYLPKIFTSLDFEAVSEWIIIHTGSAKTPLFPQSKKIKEYFYKGPDPATFVLNKLPSDGYLYFTDGAHTVHPDLYKLLGVMDEGRLYTFEGDHGTFLIDAALCKGKRVDAPFLQNFCNLHPDKWVHVSNRLGALPIK